MHPGTHAATTPDKPAIITAGSDNFMTYGQLDAESRRLAHAFRAAGLKVGDRVAIAMGNQARYLTVCWAARRVGLYYVPINWHLTTDEMQYVVENSGSKVVVTDDHCGDAAVEVVRRTAGLQMAITSGAPMPGFEQLDGVLEAQPDVPLEHETEGLDMIYTSGTTGRPKGGMNPLRDVDPGKVDSEILGMLGAAFGISSSTRYLTPGAPLYHAAPLRFSMSVIEAGGTLVLMERFDAEAALEAIEVHRVDMSQWVPTMFVRLLRLERQVRERYDLSSHQLAIHGAAPCPVSVKEEMIEWWGPILVEYYGASEGGTFTVIDSADWLAHKGSVGRPLMGTLHVLDDDGNELPPGEPGVLYVEGAVPIEYLDDEPKTMEAYNSSGWSTVGDMGYLDSEGYLYLTDRKSHMIIVGGVNIYPHEIEDVLIRHASVVDVAVIGVPNEEFGQEVKAVVQLENVADGTDHLAQDLVALCHTRLASYKCPRSVDFVEELPRTEAGKLYKRRLMDRYWEGTARI